MTTRKIAFVFPGQGAQYVGMASEFLEHYSIARETFEEADDLLGRKLSTVVLNGPEDTLTETRNSQPGIFVSSIAIYQCLKGVFPEINPFACAGLSLGEYTALHLSGRCSFADTLALVQKRADFMNDACCATAGGMSVVMGLNTDVVESVVSDLKLPHDLWIANYNCPGQIVISGTANGLQLAAVALKEAGAKRVLPLQVHGAFHSGLMQSAEDRLAPYIEEVALKDSGIKFAMNVPGALVTDLSAIRKNLILQVTHSVRWEPGIRALAEEGVDLFVEVGCGKSLSGLNRKIGITAQTISVEKVSELKNLEQVLVG